MKGALTGKGKTGDWTATRSKQAEEIQRKRRITIVPIRAV